MGMFTDPVLKHAQSGLDRSQCRRGPWCHGTEDLWRHKALGIVEGDRGTV